MKRLPKGFGSVQTLTGSRRKPYAVRIWNNNTARYKYIGYYSTYQEALTALAEYNKNPYDANLANITVAELWEIFQERRFSVISDSGKIVYTAAFKHLKSIHSVPIRELKTYTLQAAVDNIPRGWETKSHALSLLNQLFNIAMELDVIQKNYAAFVKLPSKPQSSKHSAFTKEEIKILFENVFAEKWADTVLILIYTGMRPSELLKIKTADVHLNERYMVGGLKTKAGRERVIPICDKVLPFIRKRFNPNTEYLIEENNKPVTYSHYAKYFADCMKSLNMKHLPHDGRHTFASMANTKGINATSVKLIMGHSSGDITEKVYTHKAVEELLQAVNTL